MAQAIADDDRRKRHAQAEMDARHRQEGRIERARGRSLTALVRIGLEAHGFIRYNRNPWKTRRTMKALPAPSVNSAAKERLAAKRAEIREAIYNLVHIRADGAIQRLQALARDFPDAWEGEVANDVVRLARGILADKYLASSNGSKLRDDLLARMHMVTADLAGPDPSPARRLCAEVASFAWAETWMLSVVVGGTFGTDQSREASTRLQGAQRRLQSALRTHAQIESIETRRVQPEVVNATFKVIR